MAKKDNGDKEIAGLGLTRAQLLDYLRAREDDKVGRPAFLRYLYDIEDWMNEGALVTENTPRMVMNKIRMKIILAAHDPEREKPLIQIFLEEYNREMIALQRQGRQEALGALQALMAEAGEEHAITTGGR